MNLKPIDEEVNAVVWNSTYYPISNSVRNSVWNSLCTQVANSLRDSDFSMPRLILNSIEDSLNSKTSCD